jgi:hypothetical protein
MLKLIYNFGFKVRDGEKYLSVFEVVAALI